MLREGKSSLVIQEEGTWRRRGVHKRLSSVLRRNDYARWVDDRASLMVSKHWSRSGRTGNILSISETVS